MAAAVNRPLPHYRLGDLGIVPRSHPKLGERPRATSPLAPISKQTRSIGVQTVSAQKVSGAPSFWGHTCVLGPSAVMVQKTKGRRPFVDGLISYRDVNSITEACLEKRATWFQILTNKTIPEKYFFQSVPLLACVADVI